MIINLMQELATEIWINFVLPRIPKDDPLRLIQNNFKNSYNIIKTFGRYPHRNTILGRESTKDEVILNILNQCQLKVLF